MLDPVALVRVAAELHPGDPEGARFAAYETAWELAAAMGVEPIEPWEFLEAEGATWD